MRSAGAQLPVVQELRRLDERRRSRATMASSKEAPTSGPRWALYRRQGQLGLARRSADGGRRACRSRSMNLLAQASCSPAAVGSGLHGSSDASRALDRVGDLAAAVIRLRASSPPVIAPPFTKPALPDSASSPICEGRGHGAGDPQQVAQGVVVLQPGQPPHGRRPGHAVAVRQRAGARLGRRTGGVGHPGCGHRRAPGVRTARLRRAVLRPAVGPIVEHPGATQADQRREHTENLQGWGHRVEPPATDGTATLWRVSI